MFYSQFKQDQTVFEKYYYNINKGYFVDIGAHNGVTFSNSKFFEELGWDGVCIEANPNIFGELQKNRKCECVNKALSNKQGKFPFVEAQGEDMLSGLVDELDEKSYKKIKDKHIIEVDCDLFSNVVLQKNINFLSLDTEGSELSILKTIDFNYYNIDIISVENNECTTDIYDFMLNLPYHFITKLGVDELYKKINFHF